MARLEGRVAIVTGGGRGIGRGISRAFASEGAAVCVAELDADSCRETVAEIESGGGRALAVVCDVSQSDQVEQTVATVVREFGGIDILVNNATGAREENSFKPVLEHTDEDWDEKIAVDLKGSFYFMTRCFPHLCESRGKIINLCSLAGTERSVGFVAYAAIKEALRTLTGVAAKEWGEHGVTVNALCPTALTPGVAAFLESNPEAAERAVKNVPLGRMGDPEADVGRAAIFLASSDSDFMTGQTLWFDGGQTIHA
ncbi:SDR family oxidoreductase [Myxococcota bacterium]|nr:SDR family oxidoreductase [Myxococcota bacterium]